MPVTVRTVRYALMAAALASSGAYVFVYLWRWEWHRAVVAGVVFLAAEIALATSVVLERLRALENRLERREAAAEEGAVRAARARLAEAAPEPRAGFGWLTEDANRMSVFVPLLLGAGVVLSGLAWCVERLGRATAGPVLERTLAARLAPLTLSAGTLAHGVDRPAAAGRARRWHRPTVLLATGVVVTGAALGLGALADATQNRPDLHVTGSGSAVEMQVHHASSGDTLATGRNLWGACAGQLGARHRVSAMTLTGPARVQVAVTPAIGKYGERRLRGCLQDATTDKVRAVVLRVSALPAP